MSDLSPIQFSTTFLGRLATGLWLALLPVAASHGQCAPEFDSDEVVHLLQEPRHRTVYKQGGLFLLDVQINPRDASFPHTHNQAILLTYISDGDGPRFGELRAVTEYARRPLTHVVDNPGPGLLHIIALVNDGRGVAPATQDQPSGLAAEPSIENPWFRAWRLALEPGEQVERQTHRNPTVIVQGSPGLLQVTRTDGITDELAKPGAWAWRDRDSPFTIRNQGDTRVIVTINEGRRAP